MIGPSSSSTRQVTRNRDEGVQNGRLTIPNLLCAIRLVGSAILLGLGIAGQDDAFLILFVLLALTDWVDGKLAILLNQRSILGARLDSWADAALYTALLLGGLSLRWEVLLQERWWICPALISYALTTGVGLWKFGRWPSYHTRAAKISWLLITIGAICLLAGWTLWPFRLAMVAVTLTNLEATLITCLLRDWRANVTSLYHARRSPSWKPDTSN